MCGIAGVVRTDGASVAPEVLEAMTQAMAHRGPDGWGTGIWGAVGLGHRRLAIIDLEGGRQPISNEDEQVWITFNGEIYNYRELREVLLARGHRFRTNSDTEVIVHAYEEWGERCVERFRGMFAFAVADLKNRRLFLARDHLGIKPLFYYQGPDCVAFASELQALLCLPEVPWKIDLEALDQYLTLQYIPAPNTAFRQIRKLPAAHRLTIPFDGGSAGPEEYWRLEFRPEQGRGEDEWVEALDGVMRDSVRSHLVADVPFGAFLSGGVDSSGVVAYMAGILNAPVRTFSIGFEEQEFDELRYAKAVAEQWGTEHHAEIVKPNALEILPALVRHYGEPFGDNSALPTFYLSKVARSSVPMVLSGDGGDESFAGYWSYGAWMEFLSGIGVPGWKRALRYAAQVIQPERFPSRRPTLGNWLRLIQAMDARRRQALWRPEFRGLCAQPLSLFEQEFQRAAGYSPCHQAQYMDLKTYLPYDILAKVDVASMMHGLEVRTPMVDVRVVEFAATIPESLNLQPAGNRQWAGKRLFKKLLRKYYPSDFLDRRKQGFAIPMARWFGSDGAWSGLVRERLMESGGPLHDYFQPEAMRELIDANASVSLWLLLVLDEWLRQNRTGVSW